MTESMADDVRRCIVCLRRHLQEDEPQTCRECIIRVKQHLNDIRGLWIHLPAEAHAHWEDCSLPGGSALVMMGPGSAGTHDALLGDLATDADPPSLPYELGQWEDDWRREHGHPAAVAIMTVEGAAAYLGTHTTWAARWHPAFDEYAADLRRLRAALIAVTQAGRRSQRSDVTCLGCGQSELEREFYVPRPCDGKHGGKHRESCDQGGRRDWWVCPRCGEIYDQERYALAAGETVKGQREREAHGTKAAYVRHRRRDEEACEPCLEANREYLRMWRASRVA